MSSSVRTLIEKIKQAITLTKLLLLAVAIKFFLLPLMRLLSDE